MKILFEFIAKLYCIIITRYENFFLKKKNKLNFHLNEGYLVLKNKIDRPIEYTNSQKIEVNKYLKKIIFNESEILNIINKVFIEYDLKKTITECTGLNYSIDFFTAYETTYISENEKSIGWYANKIHKDKPFSENTLKIIIPMDEIKESNGPMEILSIEDSNSINKKKIEKRNFFKFTGSRKDIFIFKPNLCFHLAGIPEKNKNRKQIMMQLNPSRYWRYNMSIAKLQIKREPKFPIFSYMFKKIQYL